LVSVSLLFERSEVVALDVMAAQLGLDRGRLVRSALGLVAVLGPDALAVLENALHSGADVVGRVELVPA
jgi:hypothetical protein